MLDNFVGDNYNIFRKELILGGSMIILDDDKEVLIDGEPVDDFVKKAVSSSKSSSTTRRVVIKNGKVVEDTTTKNDNDFINNDGFGGLDDVKDIVMRSLGLAFGEDFVSGQEAEEKEIIVECEYCRSKYKSSEENCPNCGANNNELTV